MKRLFKIRFDPEAVEELSLHVCVTGEEVNADMARLWGSTLTKESINKEELAKDVALFRAAELLRGRIRDMIQAIPVEGQIL